MLADKQQKKDANFDIAKGGVIYLVPERPMRAFRGVARGATDRELREKKDRV